MKNLYISLLLSSFGCMHAGTLPADFHFKPASNERTSFIAQYKEYEEKKAGLHHEHEASEIVQQEATEIDQGEFQELSLFERCKKLIIQLIAFFSKKSN